MMTDETIAPTVNGVPLARSDESLDAATLRQRAHVELLRQEAIAAALLSEADPLTSDGAISEAASNAIERLLEQALQPLAADEETCERFYAANAARFAVGERVHVRHILFAVTPGVDVNALRKHAETRLIDLRASVRSEPEKFAAAAREFSNCPSSIEGGDLGWLQSADCAPEFARELFGKSEVGVLPRLLHSRFGFHIVEVIARQAGVAPSFDECKSAVKQHLMQQSFATALRQYLQLLAGRSQIIGIELDSAASPLVR
jgi:peptidyl-prolyl cis-trans isomerase C